MFSCRSFAADVDATRFPGSDPCAQVNAALATLPPYGGVIDATGFNQVQLGNPCHTTITVSVPATLKFGPVSWTIAANPGINIKSPRVAITCQHAGEADIYGLYPATLYSGGAYPLISDTVASAHGTDEFAIHNCALDGHGMGTFGLFFPYGFAGIIDQSTTRSFTAAGQFILDGHWTAYGNSSASNGGDGVVWSYDGVVDGYPQYVLNGGVGLHNINGGTNFHTVTAYHNRLHGIYLDGRWIQDWSPISSYVVPSFIAPQAGNAGRFVFYTQKVGTTGGARPSFCQTVGCTVTDGSVTWINVGTAMGYGLAPIFNTGFYWASIEAPTCVDNGYDEPLDFVSDNIRIEGSSTFPVRFTSITTPNCVQSRTEDFAATGIHLLNTDYIPISNFTWLGSGFVNVPGGAGLLVENSSDITLSGMVSQFAYANTIKLINTQNSIFNAIIAVDTAVASTPLDGTYGIYIDSRSSNNIFDSIRVRDNRTPPHSRGIFNAGRSNLISNYTQTNLLGQGQKTELVGSYNSLQVPANLPLERGLPNSGSGYWPPSEQSEPLAGTFAGGVFTVLQLPETVGDADCFGKQEHSDADHPDDSSDGSKISERCSEPGEVPEKK
jgi:hypothetical protein